VPLPARDDVVVDGDLAATAWHRLVATGSEPDWREAGRMVAAVHAIEPRSLPRGQSVPPCESFPWWHFDARLAEVDGALDAAARAGLVEVIERHAGWTEGLERVVCHGDVHPGNVMRTSDGVTLLDWDMLCAGPPAWDHAMLMRLDRWGWPPRWYDEFTGGYGRSLAGDPTAEALADLRLVAATLMRLRAGLADPSAMPEAQLRLAYWRGDADAPVWTAV
jgi:Ser/Thr protein kinase RdoA (MazF antagonist)